MGSKLKIQISCKKSRLGKFIAIISFLRKNKFKQIILNLKRQNFQIILVEKIEKLWGIILFHFSSDMSNLFEKSHHNKVLLQNLYDDFYSPLYHLITKTLSLGEAVIDFES